MSNSLNQQPNINFRIAFETFPSELYSELSMMKETVCPLEECTMLRSSLADIDSCMSDPGSPDCSNTIYNSDQSLPALTSLHHTCLTDPGEACMMINLLISNNVTVPLFHCIIPRIWWLRFNILQQLQSRLSTQVQVWWRHVLQSTILFVREASKINNIFKGQKYSYRKVVGFII